MLDFNKWDAMDEFDKQRLERLWNTEFDRVMWAEPCEPVRQDRLAHQPSDASHG